MYSRHGVQLTKIYLINSMLDKQISTVGEFTPVLMKAITSAVTTKPFEDFCCQLLPGDIILSDGLVVESFESVFYTQHARKLTSEEQKSQICDWHNQLCQWQLIHA